jgi:DNA repair exonuclease SbcCD ATPase subunit/DNA repair exonuclease SbcCD nuclease subunit
MVRVAHLADVHFRGLSRHSEYREVFDAFAEDAKQAKVDAILVAGDIFHTKTTGISPEYIQEISRWMTLLSTIAPTHITLGNHDGNLVNMSRQDAVTPIYDIVQANVPAGRLFLHKFSGVYDFLPGIKLCVLSIFDEDNWKVVNPVDGHINIATYHGPVKGAQTESDWTIDDGLLVDSFSRYDFAMLGDIHKTQFLGYRKTKNGEKPWIAYPGSTLQQTYKESLDHGYLLWNIESRDDFNVEFRILPNPRPFVTLNWHDDVEATANDAFKYEKGSRFRIKSDVHLTQKDIQGLSSILKNDRNASEVTFKIDVAEKISAQAQYGSLDLAHEDIRNPEAIVKLIMKFHENTKLDDDESKQIKDLVRTYLQQATLGDEVSRGSKWSLRQLKFDNTFTYGPNNVINFDKLSGVTGIFGPNRVGKSSIPGTLAYVLYNDTDRGSIKNQYVCNIRKPFCYGRALIAVNGVDYVIERQTTKFESKSGVEHAITSLNAWRVLPNGELEDLAGEARNDTEKVIRRLLGTSDDFLITALSSQGDADSYVKYGSTRRWQVLARFLDIDVFAKMADLVKEDIKVAKAQLRNYPEKNWSELAVALKADFKSCDHDLAQKVADLLVVQNQLALLRAQLAKYDDITPVTEDELSSAKTKKVTLTSRLGKLQRQIDTCNASIKTINDDSDKLRDELQTYDVETLNTRLVLLKSLREQLATLRHNSEKQQTASSTAKKSVKLLDTVPCGDTFPTCRFIKDAHENRKNLATLEATTKAALDAVSEAEDTLQTLIAERVEDALSNIQRIQEQIKTFDIDLLKKENEIVRLQAEFDATTIALRDATAALGKLEESVHNDQNTAIIDLQQQIDALDAEAHAIDKEKLALASRKGRIESDVLKLADERRQREKILKSMKVHELLFLAFSKKGIPRMIISTQLPAINAEISKILSGIVNYTVEFENDEDSDKLDLYLNYGDSRRIIELGSGMEKMMASIAIRVAMTNVSSLPRPDIFIIDEGFGNLDESNLESCTRLLRSLTQYFRNVLVISHVDAIKDAIDNMIEITRDERESRVVYD